MADSAANTSVTAGTQCHLLPCDIEYDGNAPVHVYFHPTPLEEDGDDSSSNNADTKSESTKMLAAQLRGRGLLCVEPAPLPADVAGTVLTTDNSKKDGVEILAKFDRMHEWHHEHDVLSVKRNALKGKDVVVRANEWIQIARAVHEPIDPVA